ncbi:MAG: hypothetical protein ACLP0J_24490 [Solirubrobacteraceae bacterium]
MSNKEIGRSSFGGSAGSSPGLSWYERRVLADTKFASAQSVKTMERVERQLSSVEFIVDQGSRGVAGAVWGAISRLEGSLGLRLYAQTEVLSQQLDMLKNIEVALLTPAKTRAAERIAGTGELLRRGRWERALALANEAIEADPNNPAGFRAAAWALLGLSRTEEARAHFLECAGASDGSERSQALRQAARLTLTIDGAAAALAILPGDAEQLGDEELRAVNYDRAVYLVTDGDVDSAKRTLTHAFEEDDRYAMVACNDPLLESHPELVGLATDYLQGLSKSIDALDAEISDLLGQAVARLAEYGPGSGLRVPEAGAVANAQIVEQRTRLVDEHSSAVGVHGTSLRALEAFLRDDLLPRCAALRTQADELQERLESFKARQTTLQALVDQSAGSLAADEHAVVKPEAPCLAIAPGFEVWSATVTRKQKPLRPGKTWLITVDETEKVEIRKQYYRG